MVTGELVVQVLVPDGVRVINSVSPFSIICTDVNRVIFDGVNLFHNISDGVTFVNIICDG